MLTEIFKLKKPSKTNAAAQIVRKTSFPIIRVGGVQYVPHKRNGINAYNFSRDTEKEKHRSFYKAEADPLYIF